MELTDTSDLRPAVEAALAAHAPPRVPEGPFGAAALAGLYAWAAEALAPLAPLFRLRRAEVDLSRLDGGEVAFDVEGVRLADGAGCLLRGLAVRVAHDDA